MHSLPVVCLICHHVFRHVEVSRAVRPGESVGGICPEHMKPVDARLFGGRSKVSEQQAVGRQYREPAELDVETLR